MQRGRSHAVNIYERVRYHGNIQVLHLRKNTPDVLESKDILVSMQHSSREAERIHLMQTIIVRIIIYIMIWLHENNLITVEENARFDLS